MLATAPVSLESWVSRFARAEIPVLRRTIAAIDRLRESEDTVDVQTIAQVVMRDPLMTLKLFAHLARHRSSRLITEAETVTAALLMIGVSPFFRAFPSLTAAEACYAGDRDQVRGLYEVLRRARRASMFAYGFAAELHDGDAEVIAIAALLHDFVELLLWCHEPAMAAEIRRRQRADPALRSAQVQRDVLGFELGELEQALMKTWRLPELLIRMTDDRHASLRPVRTVMLAIQLARHLNSGWSNPAIPDDLDEIGRLLNVSRETAREVVMRIDG